MAIEFKVVPVRRSVIADILNPGPTPPPVTPDAPVGATPKAPLCRSMDWWKQATDKALAGGQKFWGKPVQHFRGSATGETCIRALTFTAMGHNVPHHAKLKRIFRTGNATEDANMQTMREVPGLVLEPPPKPGDYYDGQWEALYDDPPIVGHLDLKTLRPEDKLVLVGEIKSIRTEAFRRLPPETDDPVANFQALLKSKWGYIHQWNTYAGAPNVDLQEGFMLFEDKNCQDQLIYSLFRDEDILAATLARLRIATPYIKASPMKLAPIPENRNPRGRGDKACGSCAKRYLCIRMPDEGSTYDEVRRVDGEVRG